MLNFELRTSRDPTVNLTIAAPAGTEPPALWLEDPDDVFGFGGENHDEGNVPLKGGLFDKGGFLAGGNVLRNGGGNGGPKSGKIDLPEVILVPVDPNGYNHHCVHGVTGWYKMQFAKPFYTNFNHHVEWTNTAWTLEKNSENHARLRVSGGESSATLTGTLSHPYVHLRDLSASVNFYPCDHCDDPYHESNLYLTSSKSLLTLKYDREADLHITHAPQSTPYDSYRIEIKRTRDNNWLELSDTKTLTPWTAHVGGFFHLRGVGIRGGNETYSTNILVEVQFPLWSDIANDGTVNPWLNYAWQKTLADCTPGCPTNCPTYGGDAGCVTHDPNRRHERGFWIYLDTEYNEYVKGTTFEGDWFDPTNFPASISSQIINDAKLPDDPRPLPANADHVFYTVANFHTHTPITYCHDWVSNTTIRVTGPSKGDQKFGEGHYLPVIVYDYEKGHISFGDSKDAPAKLYCTGYERRDHYVE